jgi:glycosyltransferase involved in cell wall biosynthesis
MASVAVVIPCYGQAHFLGDALRSLAAQTQGPDEIIVVDDGSPDDVRSVTDPYREVRCIRQENRGLSQARNRGLAACSSDFVIFLDADDRLLPEAVAVGAAALASRPECAFVWGFNRGIDARGRSVSRPPTSFEGAPSYERLLERNIVGAPVGVIFRADRVRGVGGFASPRQAVEDHELYLRLAREYPFDCHGRLVAEYRHHDANMSGDPDRMLRAALLLLDREERWIASADDLPGRDGEARGTRLRTLRRALERGRRAARRLYAGEARLDQLRTLVKGGRWREAIPLAASLGSQHPGLLLGALRDAVSARVRARDAPRPPA